MANQLSRWDPARELLNMSRAMDHLFEEFYGGAPRFGGMGTFPAVDLYQNENEIVVKATIPGVKPEDLQVSVTGDVLMLRGEIQQEKESPNDSYHLRERTYGSFSRTISLPAPVVVDQAKAEFENGVLNLVLPKEEEVRPKTITVKLK
ncbi:MAG: Hsp20/alpha crystallin family protein [Anaerolineaceae bacterium]|nr:Hsp20/alpha crystallin family protein [Anaerolineaceae bacterium]